MLTFLVMFMSVNDNEVPSIEVVSVKICRRHLGLPLACS